MEGNLIENEIEINNFSETKENLSQILTNNIRNDEKKYLFKDLNIFIEIFNNTIDQSDLLDEVQIENGANVRIN